MESTAYRNESRDIIKINSFIKTQTLCQNNQGILWCVVLENNNVEKISISLYDYYRDGEYKCYTIHYVHTLCLRC